jgi:hypothetical protein
MTEVESRKPLVNTPLKSLHGYRLGISNIIYQVSLAKDGTLWCALIGPNIQEGISGFGNTVQEALRDLADKIE